MNLTRQKIAASVLLVIMAFVHESAFADEAGMQAEISNLKSNTRILDERLGKLSAKVNALSTQVNDLSTQVNANRVETADKLLRHQKETDALSGKIQNLQNQINALKAHTH